MAKEIKKQKRAEGPEQSRRIVVGMSGGVDSSVSAVLLKQAGFDVVGVMMKFWKDPSTGSGQVAENRCCSVESERLARLVAKNIGIPFYVINVEREFKKKVVDYFLAEYKAGRTPNPCVVCNKEIKFGLFIERALKMGADFVATGHYANTSFARSNSLGNKLFSGSEVPLLPSASRPKPTKSSLPREFTLLKAMDKEKDQSYFLWKLNQKQLSRVLFPVGNYTKPEVRKLAEKFNLPSANVKESQEVCFVNNTTNNFLKKYLKQKPGKIIDISNKNTPLNTGVFKGVVGTHDGAFYYTIGQRRGLHLPRGPWYVVGKNFAKDVLYVSKNKKDLLKKEMVVKNVNWISGKESKFPLKVKVKIRYKAKEASAIIYKLSTTNYKLVFDNPQPAITPGQSAVFYKGNVVLGGGIIK